MVTEKLPDNTFFCTHISDCSKNFLFKLSLRQIYQLVLCFHCIKWTQGVNLHPNLKGAKMFNKTKFIAVLVLLSISLIYAGEEKFGKEITLKEKTSLSTILSEPDKFNGKPVLVEGTILAVCQGMGCWIEVAGENENEKIKVKVEDGVIVFPKDAKGKTALVEGIVAEVKSDACESEHEGEHKEKEGDGCCSGSAKTKVYQIEGLGAVIK